MSPKTQSKLKTCTGNVQLSARLNPFAAALAAGLFFSSSEPAQAATINVTASCNLRQAIIAANTDAPASGCTAGSGPDTIVLPTNQSQILTASLTDVTSVITIEGNNSSRTRSNTVAPFRIFTVRAGGNLTVNNMTISGGATPGSSFPDDRGGGILNQGVLTLNNCIVSGNSASTVGGGIASTSNTQLFVNHSTISGNRTSTGPVGGGGVGVIGANAFATIVDSTVSNNSAGLGGGIAMFLSGGGKLSLIRTTVSGNSVRLRGGGIYSDIPDNQSAQVVISNSTLSGNSAGHYTGGGGIYNYNGAMVISDSTVTGNTVAPGGYGGGVAVYGFGATPTSISRSIISGNTSSDVEIVTGGTDILSGGSNLVGIGNAASAFVAAGDQINVVNPVLGPLADNGGPSFTHALLTGSPAIDTVVGGCAETVDQRNFLRPRDGDGNGTALCDKGAFERQPTADLSILVSDAVDPIPQGQPINYTLAIANAGPDGAPGTVVTDTLSPGTTFLSASPSTGSCSVSGAIVTCNLGILASGNTATVNLSARADQLGLLSNTASVSSSVSETFTPNNTDTETTDVRLGASINDVRSSEGNSGSKNFEFTLGLSSAPSATVQVNYATANGTASAGSDYVAKTGTVVFAAGQTSKGVKIAVIGDTLVEGDETFFVNLSAPTGGTVIADGQGQGTILNDDANSGPRLTVNDVSVTEGKKKSKAMTFTIGLNPAASGPVSVNYATANGSATAGSDYSQASGSVNFAAGQTSATVNVTVFGDKVVEPDETLFLNLSSPSGAAIDDAQGQGIILNDD